MKLLLILLASTGWFAQQKNARGDVCCWESDGEAYYSTYTLNPNGSATLADKTLVPKGFVIPANPTGHAILWLYPNGTPKCFSPGTLT